MDNNEDIGQSIAIRRKESGGSVIEVSFFIILINSVSMMKRIPATMTFEYTLQPPDQEKNSSKISFRMIAKIKSKLTAARDRLYKIFYYDSKMMG